MATSKDGLNYQEARKRPIDDMASGYEERNTNSKNEKPSDSMDVLRKQYDKDPNSLNPTQLLTLGLYELKSNKDNNDKDLKGGE